MVHWRWAIDKDKICFKEANWGIMALAVSAFLQKRATKTQGVGRHSKTEILKIIRRDFETFSNFLGTVIVMNVFATFLHNPKCQRRKVLQFIILVFSMHNPHWINGPRLSLLPGHPPPSRKICP